MEKPAVDAILLAAGCGSRMGVEVNDKILHPLAGQSVFWHVVNAFLRADLFRCLHVVYRNEDQKNILLTEWEGLCRSLNKSIDIQWVPGGDTRQDSVFNGLAAVSSPCESVFIHDCARPLITPIDLQRLAKSLQKDPAVALAHPVTDTIKIAKKNNGEMRQCHLQDVPRDSLWAMETPQCFHYAPLFAAYQSIRDQGIVLTDDTGVAERAGIPVTLLEPSYPNPKITHTHDIAWAELLLQNRPVNLFTT